MEQTFSPDLKILFVEDEPLLQRLCGRFLNGQQRQVITVNSSKDAIGLIKSNHYDLLITDYFLPDGNGGDVIKAFAARSPMGNALLITGMLMNEASVRDLPTGFTVDYLLKPFDIDSFDQLVKDILIRVGLSGGGPTNPQSN